MTTGTVKESLFWWRYFRRVYTELNGAWCCFGPQSKAATFSFTTRRLPASCYLPSTSCDTF